MSKFIFKPSYIDFGYEPSTQTAKFIHEGASITLVEKPDWVSDVSIEYTPYVSGVPIVGTLTAIVSNDVASRKFSGSIIVSCDAEQYVIPCVYLYDSEHIKISDVLDAMMWKLGDTSYIGERDRVKALSVAKRWMRDNPGSRSINVRFVELPIEDVAYVYVPADFKSYVGLFTHTYDGYLMPIYVNDNINTADYYLTDENGFFVSDENGYVISTYGSTPHPTNAGEYTYYGANVMPIAPSIGKQITVPQGEISLNGICRYEPNSRRFVVNGVATDKVILQYVSDPILRDKLKMDVGGLSIHKNYQNVLENYIYWNLVDTNRNVPQYRDWETDRKSTRLNSSHSAKSRMPSSA